MKCPNCYSDRIFQISYENQLRWLMRCSSSLDVMGHHVDYCPDCGHKLVDEDVPILKDNSAHKRLDELETDLQKKFESLKFMICMFDAKIDNLESVGSITVKIPSAIMERIERLEMLLPKTYPHYGEKLKETKGE